MPGLCSDGGIPVHEVQVDPWQLKIAQCFVTRCGYSRRVTLPDMMSVEELGHNELRHANESHRIDDDVNHRVYHDSMFVVITITKINHGSTEKHVQSKDVAPG